VSAHHSQPLSGPGKHFPKRLAKPLIDDRINQWITCRIEKIKEEADSEHHMGVSYEYGVSKKEQDKYAEQAQRENCDGENDNHWSHDFVEPFAARFHKGYLTASESSTEALIRHLHVKRFALVQFVFDGAICYKDQGQRDDVGK